MADALFDRALELVMDAGQTLLENGGEVFRAQQTLIIISFLLNYDHICQDLVNVYSIYLYVLIILLYTRMILL